MTERPVLLYLHGVGRDDLVSPWRTALDSQLTALGHPSLDEVEVIEPRYPNTLRYPTDDKAKLPPVTTRRLSKDDYQEHQHRQERATAALERLLAWNDAAYAPALGEQLHEAASQIPFFSQARRYFDDDNVRALVLRRILDELPTVGQITIVAHSLGSVIAMDLLPRLPVDVHVRGVVTIGSPGGNPRFHDARRRQLIKHSLPNVDWWVNFWRAIDPVTGGRGITRIVPWSLDHRIAGRRHEAHTYLSDPDVAGIVGRSLFGATSKELVVANSLPELALNDSEQMVLLSLAFGHHLADALDAHTKDRGQRYRRALAHVQTQTIERIRVEYAGSGRPLPRALDVLSDGSDLDLIDPADRADLLAIRPAVTQEWNSATAIGPLVSLVLSNPIAPFEIDVAEVATAAATRALCADLGLPSAVATTVIDQVKRVRESIAPPGAGRRWWLLGIGGAALLAGPVGLMLAAPAALTGGAAIVAALAAFGPGGMIGGLVTAGALTTLGAGATATAFARSATPVELERAIVQVTAIALVRRELGHDDSDLVAVSLAELESQIRRDLRAHEMFSDPKGAAALDLRRKVDALVAAQKLLELEPGAEPEPDTDVAVADEMLA